MRTVRGARTTGSTGGKNLFKFLFWRDAVSASAFAEVQQRHLCMWRESFPALCLGYRAAEATHLRTVGAKCRLFFDELNLTIYQ